MAGNIGRYDAREVVVTIGGQIITGFAENTFVSCKKKENNSKTKYSAQGDAAMAVSNNSGGEIEITLMQTSPSVAYLNSLATKGTLVPAWVKSTNAISEQYGGTAGVVLKPADADFSDDITDRKFTVEILDYTAK